MLKKLILLTIVLGAFLIFLLQPKKTPVVNTYESLYNKPLPAIVSHFACSDNCPGDPLKYTIQIYEGVSDEAECRFLGGSIYKYYGWGEYTVCRVNSEKGKLID